MLSLNLLELSRFAIHVRYLLETRVIIATYNQHVRLLSSRALIGWHHQSLLGQGSRHCYGIITLVYFETGLYFYRA